MPTLYSEALDTSLKEKMLIVSQKERINFFKKSQKKIERKMKMKPIIIKIEAGKPKVLDVKITIILRVRLSLSYNKQNGVMTIFRISSLHPKQ